MHVSIAIAAYKLAVQKRNSMDRVDETMIDLYDQIKRHAMQGRSSCDFYIWNKDKSSLLHKIVTQDQLDAVIQNLNAKGYYTKIDGNGFYSWLTISLFPFPLTWWQKVKRKFSINME